MTTLTWYAKRLARMSPEEVAGRSRDAALHRRWRRRQVSDDRADTTPLPAASPSFAATLSLSPTAVPEMSRARLLAAADELLDGRWPVFALSRTDMSPSPDWFRDPKTGSRAPADAYCFTIDHRREDAVGNVKYLWGRLATSTALCSRPPGGSPGARTTRRQPPRSCGPGGQRTRSCPVSTGRAASSSESACCRGCGCDDSSTGGPASRTCSSTTRTSSASSTITRSTSPPCRAGERPPTTTSSPRWPACSPPAAPSPGSLRARSGGGDAGDTLARELPRQTFPDGLNRELATAYHAFVLELGLTAALEGERSGHPLGEEVWRTLRAMTDAAAAVVDVRLRPPRQGDDDEGHGLLLDPPTYDRWASLLATGERLFGRKPWWPDVPRNDVRTTLLSGLAAAPAVPSGRPTVRPSMFPDAGVVILRTGHGRSPEIWCRGDVGPHGYLRIAAHAHADALSVEVRVDGVDVLADPGTYCYHGEPAWRSWFRSTSAHNTLEVAGRDQSTSGGPFLWTRHARTRLERATGLDDGRFAEWQAVHDGYRHLSLPPGTADVSGWTGWPVSWRSTTSSRARRSTTCVSRSTLGRPSSACSGPTTRT